MCSQGTQVQSYEAAVRDFSPTQPHQQANPPGTSDLHAPHLGVGMAFLLPIPLLP